MENQEHFGRLTDRMAAFREEVLEEKPYGSRAYVTKDFRKHEHLY